MLYPTRLALVFASLLVVGAWGTAQVDTVCAAQESTLLAPDGAAMDHFGFSVSVSGTTAVIGAYTDDAPLVDSGSTHIFERGATGWNWSRKLVAPDAAATDRFGANVAIDGGTLAVAAPFDDVGGQNTGSVYVYIRSGTEWTGQAKIQSPDPGAGDLFGGALAISGNTLLIASPFHTHVGGNSGAGSAYIFVRTGTTWNLQAELRPNDPADNDAFGSKLALDGDTAVIGMPSDDDDGTSSGSAYVFVRNGTVWTQQQKLKASDPAPVQLFGDSIAVRGDTAIIGAPRDDDRGIDAGAAYVFERVGTTWTETSKLTAADGETMDMFGLATAVWGDVALVGSRWDDDAGSLSGSATFFSRVGASWVHGTKIVADDAMAGDIFGFAVSMTDTYALVGAFTKSANGVGSGGAYTYAYASGLASEISFNGTPANPVALMSGQSSGPILGQTWDPVIDHSSFFPGALADLLIVTPTAPLNAPTVYGTLLCSVAPPSDLFLTLAGTPFTLGIPNDCSFVGLSICAQGGSFAPGPVIQLTNALALVLGTR